MKTKKQAPTVKQYRLKQSSAPLSYFLPTRHTRRSPLLYFDKDKNINTSTIFKHNSKIINIFFKSKNKENQGNAQRNKGLEFVNKNL